MAKAMISIEGILKCEKFIYDKLLECHTPKTEKELAKLYISDVMKNKDYTEEQVASESANFGMALMLLIGGKRICEIGDMYYIVH